MRPTEIAATTSGRRRRDGGFGLVETMVVVGLLAIVIMFAAPSFVSIIGTMNTKSAAFDLIGDLAMARSEALKRNATVSIVPVSSSWSNGWQVLRGAEVLRARPALASNLSVSAAPTSGVVFQPNGRLANTDTSTGNLSWSITSTHSDVIARCVVISPTGSARSKPGACS
jgi:type IV fimbrial biogenesis protein FimT